MSSTLPNINAAPTPAEQELITLFRAGDQQAFTTVYSQLYQRLYWYGRKIIDQAHEVEDMIADGFIQLWKRKEEFESTESISRFMHVIVRNKCLNVIKRQEMRDAHHALIIAAIENQAPGDFFIEQVQAELMRQIFEQVDQLPENLREIFVLSFKEGLKPAEIAERLQLNVQTVKNRKVSALKLLKSAIGHDPLLLAMIIVLESQSGIIS